jgi:hypothetical protein
MLSRYQNAAAASREYAKRFPERYNPGSVINLVQWRNRLKILENYKNMQSIISVNTNILLRRFRLKFLRIMYSTSCYVLGTAQLRKHPVYIDISCCTIFAFGSYQVDIASNKYLDVSQSTVSRCLTEVTEALLHPTIFNECVKFPQNFQELNHVRTNFYQQHRFPGVIGCIDCTG